MINYKVFTITTQFNTFKAILFTILPIIFWFFIKEEIV
jgi:hypothetical protein